MVGDPPTIKILLKSTPPLVTRQTVKYLAHQQKI